VNKNRSKIETDKLAVQRFSIFGISFSESLAAVVLKISMSDLEFKVLQSFNNNVRKIMCSDETTRANNTKVLVTGRTVTTNVIKFQLKESQT